MVCKGSNTKCPSPTHIKIATEWHVDATCVLIVLNGKRAPGPVLYASSVLLLTKSSPQSSPGRCSLEASAPSQVTFRKYASEWISVFVETESVIFHSSMHLVSVCVYSSALTRFSSGMLPLGDQCEQVLPADRNINSMIPEQHKGLSEAKGRGKLILISHNAIIFNWEAQFLHSWLGSIFYYELNRCSRKALFVGGVTHQQPIP